LAGFTSAEGCFFINIIKSSSNKIGSQVSLSFIITQHIRDRGLMVRIKNLLDCGDIKESPSRPNIIQLKVTNFNNNLSKVIPFFSQMIQGVKKEDFNS
jgi:hypothetical protein